MSADDDPAKMRSAHLMSGEAFDEPPKATTAGSIEAADLELAARYAPVLVFDEREPFLPIAAGVHLFREDGASPSFPRHVELRPPGSPAAEFAIEYAIWWDWDIGHLYELEHVWVYVDDRGRPVRAEASWHGRFFDARLGEPGGAELRGDRVVLYSQPGKHAFAPSPEWFTGQVRASTLMECGRGAGRGGVWVTPLFRDRITVKCPEADRLVHTYLERLRFEPTFSFTREVVLARERLVPWYVLARWIPGRVAWWVEELRRTIPPSQRRWLRIAHRGASAHAPENSELAIRKAAELQADMVELDVRVQGHGMAVVSHDPPPDGVALLTLGEALDLCQSLGLGVYLDLKVPDAGKAACDEVARRSMERHVIVGAPVPQWLDEVRACMPDVATALQVPPEVRTVEEALKRCIDAGAQYLHLCWESLGPRPDALLTPGDIERVHAERRGLISWHEERPEVIAALRRLGVDAACSDAPELLL